MSRQPQGVGLSISSKGPWPNFKGSSSGGQLSRLFGQSSLAGCKRVKPETASSSEWLWVRRKVSVWGKDR